MKYLLDTNICIYAQKRNPAILSHMKEAWQEGIAISAITHAELEYGMQHSAPLNAMPLLWQNFFQLWRFCRLTVLLPLNMVRSARRFGKMEHRSERWIC